MPPSQDENSINSGDNSNNNVDPIFRTNHSIDDLVQRIIILENQVSGLNPRNLSGIRRRDLALATLANIFGDGSDGDVTLSGSVSITRDMFYKNLTINAGVTLSTAGFRIFVQKILTNNGIISCSGTAGGNGNFSGGAPVPGAAGTTPSGGSGALSGASGAGGAGAYGTGVGIVAGTNGGNGTNCVKSLGSAGAAGGGGGRGDGSHAGLGGGNAGSTSGTVYNIPRSPVAAFLLIDGQPAPAVLTGPAGSGGGGGGGEALTTGGAYGGSGGGGGGAGGVLPIFAFRLINNGVISANGGNGGNGQDGAGGAGGGGGGGGAGNGGVIILCYGEKSGAGTTSVIAGVAGTAGAASGGTAGAGSAGAGGSAGSVIEVVVGVS